MSREVHYSAVRPFSEEELLADQAELLCLPLPKLVIGLLPSPSSLQSFDSFLWSPCFLPSASFPVSEPSVLALLCPSPFTTLPVPRGPDADKDEDRSEKAPGNSSTKWNFQLTQLGKRKLNSSGCPQGERSSSLA